MAMVLAGGGLVAYHLLRDLPHNREAAANYCWRCFHDRSWLFIDDSCVRVGSLHIDGASGAIKWGSLRVGPGGVALGDRDDIAATADRVVSATSAAIGEVRGIGRGIWDWTWFGAARSNTASTVHTASNGPRQVAAEVEAAPPPKWATGVTAVSANKETFLFIAGAPAPIFAGGAVAAFAPQQPDVVILPGAGRAAERLVCRGTSFEFSRITVRTGGGQSSRPSVLVVCRSQADGEVARSIDEVAPLGWRGRLFGSASPLVMRTLPNHSLTVNGRPFHDNCESIHVTTVVSHMSEPGPIMFPPT